MSHLADDAGVFREARWRLAMKYDLRCELIALLESLEWCGHELLYVCPSCYHDKPHHKDDCALKRALAKLKEKLT